MHQQDTPLATNGTYTQTQDITLPAGIGGQYYLYVIADAVQNEIDLGNNTGAVQTYATTVYEAANGFNNQGSAPIPESNSCAKASTIIPHGT